jgi:hypothetical protein
MVIFEPMMSSSETEEQPAEQTEETQSRHCRLHRVIAQDERVLR